MNDIIFGFKVLCMEPFTGYTPHILYQMNLFTFIGIYCDYRELMTPENNPENYEYHGPITGRKPTKPISSINKMGLGERIGKKLN